jgi:replication factor A1
VQVYFISKGSLRVANKQFSNVNNDYEMTLNANSEVEEVPEDAASIQMPAMKYKFVKIDALGPYVNARELVGMSFYIHLPRFVSCFVQVNLWFRSN